MRKFDEWKRRQCAVHGEKFDTSDMPAKFVLYYESGERIQVTDERTGYTRRGYVGITTGWRPAFILLPRINSVSSGDVLTQHDTVRRVIPSKRLRGQ